MSFRAFAKNFEFQRAAFEAAQKAFQSTANNRFGNGNYGPNFQYGGGGGFGGAAASASFGPGGGHQSAGVYPENPVNTSFKYLSWSESIFMLYLEISEQSQYL